ncbi:hypothetical protein IFO69_08880 [Echinicola sp. CAU 1574]|uniref:Acetyltransferase n=1 Tax=Echinicola arenosa TaxID=2774144 RepID=A0ABR9AKL1_9BACT|nr:hypothetical protein [Echinicola arenosa]MBD8488856.1 hypothetical protein [Echinicola arenosa]
MLAGQLYNTLSPELLSQYHKARRLIKYPSGRRRFTTERIRRPEGQSPNEPIYRTFSKPVDIGGNVWTGGNVCIMPGASIGGNVTIGADSVVTRDIPDNVLAFENPCKVIKTLEE